jgi:diguanylate cyclase (GGDEF)-like protein
VRTPVTVSELQARVEMARRFMALPWGRTTPGCADALAGVLPREEVLRRLDDELARTRREHVELGVAILDVGGLARVNGAHGRPAGDAVLREVVRRVRGVLRPYDVVGRLDGEEFLVVLSKTGEPDLAGVLDRLRAAVAADPFTHDGRRLDVTVSLGGAGGGEESAGELIARAQRSLDVVQSAGPGRVLAGPGAGLAAVLMRE